MPIYHEGEPEIRVMEVGDEALAEGRQLLVALVRGEVARAHAALLPLPVGARHARDDPRHAFLLAVARFSRGLLGPA